MAIKTYNDQNFVAIANAIRAKNGETTQYKPSEMAPAIMAIESGLELLPQDTAAGAIANFPDGSNNYPVVELIANIDPKQAGSGDPAPDNVRPISGFDKVVVNNYNGNFWNEQWEIGSLTSIGADYASTTRIRNVGYISIKNGADYYIYTNGYIADIHFYDENKTHISSVQKSNSSITAPTNAYYIRFCMSTTYGTTYNNDISINGSPTDTSYHAYVEPNAKTIDLGRTVCGGTLNVTTGVLTVNRISKVLTSNDNISLKGSGASAYFQINYSPASNSNWQDIIASHFTKNNIYAGGTAQGIGIYLGQVYIRYAQFSSIEDFKNFLDTENNADRQVVITYKLAEPQTYQLTPEQVKTLLGVNNIYADTGDVEVTYRADIDLYIAKKIAEGA